MRCSAAGWALVALLACAGAARHDIPLTRIADADGGHVRYTADVDIGNPPQKVPLIVDSGTSRVVVLNESACPNAGDCYRASITCAVPDAKYSLLIDDLVPALSRICLTNTNVSLGTSLTQTDAEVDVAFDDRLSPDSLLYWSNSSGSMGIGYSMSAGGTIANSSFVQIAKDAHLRFAALQLNPAGDPSQLSLLSENETVALTNGEKFAWALPRIRTGNFKYHMFQMYDMRLCNVSLFGNYSSNWPVFFDTGSACLGLPSEFFDAVAAWITGMECKGTDRETNCTIPRTSIPHLPELSFALYEGSTEYLRIPLASLVIPGNDPTVPDVRLCLSRHASVSSSFNPPLISLGAMALQELYTVFDLHEAQIGLQNKHGASSVPSAVCSQRTPCTGAQVYYAPLNTCIDPKCSAYYFKVIDPVTKECVVSRSFQVGLVIFLSVFVGLEMVSMGLYKRLMKHVNSIHPHID